MGFLSGLLGGSIGAGIHIFSNSMMKVPMSRYPWMHVFMFTAGCYIGNEYPKAEKALVERINKQREAKGLPHLVGTSAWIQYQPEDEIKKE